MILELKDITKVYPGALALDQVSLGFEQGEIHALMGENGAGKSTLIKTISGAIAPTSGRIIIDGHSFDKMTPALSKQYGISIIYQDTNLVLPMSVAENIFLGTSQSKLFSKKKLCFLAQKIFDKYGFNLNPAVPVGSLSPANQQLVEVAKAISSECRIMIMDEPTAPLVSTEVELLFRIIRKLKKEGVTIIYISHRLAEVFEISDRISVLRDGHFIKTINTEDTDKEELISLMVGRKLGSNFPPRLTKPLPQVVLELDRVTGNSDSSISLSLHKGEILGIGGLVGSGRTELAEMICGSKKISSGQVFIKGKKVSIKNPSDAIRNGIGLIPEDRKKDGCIINNSVSFNSTLICSKDYMNAGIIDEKKRRLIAEEYRRKLTIKVGSIQAPVGSLSGGNQQKVILAKTIAANLDIIVFDEPTKGIDVGAKYEIYELMNQMTKEGKSIIVISSDMEEILGISDRIIVLYEGEVEGELKKEQFSQENVLLLASGEKLKGDYHE